MGDLNAIISLEKEREKKLKKKRKKPTPTKKQKKQKKQTPTKKKSTKKKSTKKKEQNTPKKGPSPRYIEHMKRMKRVQSEKRELKRIRYKKHVEGLLQIANRVSKKPKGVEETPAQKKKRRMKAEKALTNYRAAKEIYRERCAQR